MMTKRAVYRSSQVLWTVLCALCLSCVTPAQLQVYIEAQKARDLEQDRLIEDTASKLACNDPDVQAFVRKCREQNSKCDTGQVVSVVSKMREYSHKMFRVPYVEGQPLAINSDMAKAAMRSLFSGRILTSTRLLMVGVPSHQPKATAPPKGKRPGVRPTEAPMVPDIKTDEALRLMRKLRQTFAQEPYQLSERVISGMDPQVPSCETRSDKLLDHFRELKENELKPDEKKIGRAHV